MAWSYFAALDGFSVEEQGGFTLPLTYLLSSTGQILDGFRTSDGTVRRVYDRKPTAVVADMAAATSKHSCHCQGYWLMHRAGNAVPGAEAFLAPSYLTADEVESLAVHGDPNHDRTTDRFEALIREEEALKGPKSPIPYQKRSADRSPNRTKLGEVTSSGSPAPPPPAERLKTGECPAGVRGMLQAFAPTGPQHATFRVEWRDAECGHPHCVTLNQRRAMQHRDMSEPFRPQCLRVSTHVNQTEWQSTAAKRRAPFLSFATFDAAEGMCSVGSVAEDVYEQLRKATTFLVSHCSRKQGQDVIKFVAFFAHRPLPATNSAVHVAPLALLLIHHLEFRAWDATAKPNLIEFRAPQQFRRLQGGEFPGTSTRPKGVFAEDLVVNPSVNEVFGLDQRTRRRKRLAKVAEEETNGIRRPATSQSVLSTINPLSATAEDVLRRDTAVVLGLGDGDLWSALKRADPTLEVDPGVSTSSPPTHAGVAGSAGGTFYSTSGSPALTRAPTAASFSSVKGGLPRSASAPMKRKVHSASPDFFRVPDLRVDEDKLERERLDGQERRRAAAVLHKATALFAVLEGKRDLDANLAKAFGLSSAQRHFLKGEDDVAHYLPRAERRRSKGALPQVPQRAEFSTQSTCTERAALFDPQVARAGASRPPSGRAAPLRRRLPVHMIPREELAALPPRSSQPRHHHQHGAKQTARSGQRSTVHAHGSPPTGVPSRAESGVGDGGATDKDRALVVLSAPHSERSFGGTRSRLSSPLSSVADYKELEGFAFRGLGTDLGSDESVGLDDTIDVFEEGYNVRAAASLRLAEKAASSIAARLSRIDATSQCVPTDLVSRMEELLQQSLPGDVSRHAPSMAKVEPLQQVMRRATEFLAFLPYQMEAFFMTERAAPPALRGVDTAVSSANPDAPLGDRASVLLFSIPPGHLTALGVERRVALFLRALGTWFVAVDTAEARAILRDSNVVSHCLFDTGLYGSHLKLEAMDNATALPNMIVFGARSPPMVAELAAKVSVFVLSTLRSFYLERLDEIVEECQLALRPPDSPHYQSIPVQGPSGFSTAPM